MEDRANRVAHKLCKEFDACTAKGLGFDAALNTVAVRAYKAAECHAWYILVKNNKESVDDSVPEGPIQDALGRLLDLTILMQLQANAGDWIGVLDERAIDLIDARINQLLDEIRPDCVGLSDGFAHSDHNLKSTLGRFDGNVYEAIYEEAGRSPLNRSEKMVGWEHIGRVVDKDFLREGMKTQRAGSGSKL